MSSPFVCIIILQYNNSQDTLHCLESIKELDYPNCQVVVVDNASDEAEVDYVKKYIESQPLLQSRTLEDKGPTFLLENKENLGYAGGNNVGIKYALKNGADYVFILNNDTTIGRDSLAKLVAVAEADKDIGIVAPSLLEARPQEEIKSKNSQITYSGKISWLKSELSHSRTWPTEQYLNSKEYVIGAAMLIKKEVLEKVEGFDEIYFLYFEDADLSIRARLAGYKLKIVPEAVARHKVSASASKLGSPLILRYHIRNALIFNSLNAPWRVKTILIFWAGYIVLKNLVKMFLMPSKAPSADAIIEGVLDFYKNKFGRIV